MKHDARRKATLPSKTLLPRAEYQERLRQCLRQQRLEGSAGPPPMTVAEFVERFAVEETSDVRARICTPPPAPSAAAAQATKISPLFLLSREELALGGMMRPPTTTADAITPLVPQPTAVAVNTAAIRKMWLPADECTAPPEDTSDARDARFAVRRYVHEPSAGMDDYAPSLAATVGGETTTAAPATGGAPPLPPQPVLRTSREVAIARMVQLDEDATHLRGRWAPGRAAPEGDDRCAAATGAAEETVAPPLKMQRRETQLPGQQLQVRQQPRDLQQRRGGSNSGGRGRGGTHRGGGDPRRPRGGGGGSGRPWPSHTAR